ncbi:MAG TPA: alpha/beta hydrolase [Mycobacteriales bacterium]|nr:alpha/beta hydrolase [Mycobacteriales bacterium]
MITVRTSDGVDLALERHGRAGPLLVLVHGGVTDRHCFDPLLPSLDGYAVARYDRRGHGDSTGSATGDVDREARDLEEVLTFLGGPALLLGYSYGAMVALRAMTTRALPVHGAVLYEPPLAVDGVLVALNAVLPLVSEGRHDEAAAQFVSRAFHLSERVVDAMRRDATTWAKTVGLVPTLSAEIEGLQGALLPQAPVTAPPVRLLVAEQGGNPAFRHIADHLAAVLPDADVVAVPGLPHFAMATAPGPFVQAADEHLRRCL